MKNIEKYRKIKNIEIENTEIENTEILMIINKLYSR